MKIHYYLKKRSGQTTHPIYVALYEGQKEQLVYTGQRITISGWSAAYKSPKDHKSDVYKACEKVKSGITQAIRRLEADEKDVNPLSVKLEYFRHLKTLGEKQDAIEIQIKSDTAGVVRLANDYIETKIFHLKKSTQRAVKSSITTFTKFLKKESLARIEKKDLSRDIITQYERYLLETKKVTDNTHGKLIKHLRWFLTSVNIDVAGIKIRTFKKNIVALTLDELRNLESVDVSYSVEMEKSKHLFLLGTYLGLRISDLKRLNKANTTGGYVQLRQIKSNKDIKIPIIPACAAILEKYDYKAPKIAEHTLNKEIKKVCKKAGITSPTQYETTKAGQRISSVVPKYKLISSHNASKTFITLAPQKWGLTPAEIAHITGKDLRTLLQHYFNDQADIGRQKMIERESAIMKVAN